MQLIQYAPSTDKVFERATAGDSAVDQQVLHPRSESQEFADQMGGGSGYTVFVISWVNPDEKLRDKRFDDYMLEGSAGSAGCDSAGNRRQRRVKALAYCIGGTLLASTLAYMASKRDNRIKAATFATTLMDFRYR